MACGASVRLGAAVDDILHRHEYPPPVWALLAEAVALTAMLGASLKFDGKFILQTKTDEVSSPTIAASRSEGYRRSTPQPSRPALCRDSCGSKLANRGGIVRFEASAPSRRAEFTRASSHDRPSVHAAAR